MGLAFWINHADSTFPFRCPGCLNCRVSNPVRPFHCTNLRRPWAPGHECLGQKTVYRTEYTWHLVGPGYASTYEPLLKTKNRKMGKGLTPGGSQSTKGPEPSAA